jgi:hypothetical protein
VSPRTGLDDVERRKILPLPGLELRINIKKVMRSSIVIYNSNDISEDAQNYI